jgi:uncharacterized SAM-binding protein YcdF (DUF218 family)
MSAQGLAATLLLPPLLLVLLTLAAGVMVVRVAAPAGKRLGLLIVLAALGQLLLATPYVARSLALGLQQAIPESRSSPAPGAIVVLGAEVARGKDGLAVGPLTLERLRAAAALWRRTGLPLLVTGGPIRSGEMPLAVLMAQSLVEDFGVPARWIEAEALDTAGNARLSAAILGREGIAAAYVVTHAWHLPRALEAFDRTGLVGLPAAVRLELGPSGSVTDWVPRADQLVASWFALREWLGRVVYRLRDGPPSRSLERQ